MLCFSELILSEIMLNPNAIVALATHSNANLMPSDFSTGIDYQCLSVPITST